MINKASSAICRMTRVLPTLALALVTLAGVCWVGGCGVASIFGGVGGQEDFPNALVGDDGEHIHVTTIRTIVDDAELTDAEKRDALEALGIEDEDIQDYLLSNF